ncbi:Na+/H+ antiporter subunit G [Corynebacterium macclintockiae]|uniref:Na+/H+ antiporter subunit G n=1 Tax=Corynebacterium macclintockiae TaxID=2913501 RepID=A0A9X3M643_9CORY|nr:MULTISPECIES: Na+/H+ antiporter subunit G [Corynebacterium]MBC6794927.1 Na+/H+ antiporter subunit G [Corynebacterium sp. LK28]MCZ9304622.1 Na+/H+ antiporter subunit G [Corynebacterium macclintockiae]MDK8870347.1 Na+/H+ antiporter subunit G [Corynebacterium macclintockiae]MDK8891052.1 Na+/H+ antiporter subunit G [Corynebacterium macclintockiae]OFM61480.1 Na+/H+ antiporter subunit G [Corynebacterium sp. HMSC058E07]
MSTTILAAAGDMVEFSEPGWLGAITAGVLAILGAVFIFVSARAMYLAPDALSQVNMVGPAIGVGLPLLISANLVYSWSTEGFILGELIRAIVAITALLVIGATGSYVMGRALHATHWDHTVPLSGGQKAKEPK